MTSISSMCILIIEKVYAKFFVFLKQTFVLVDANIWMQKIIFCVHKYFFYFGSPHTQSNGAPFNLFILSVL